MGTPANSLDITQAGLVKFDGVSTFSGVTVTQFDTLVGAASNGITSINPGTSGQVLTSTGGASNPSFQTISNSNLPGSGQITLTNGTNINVTGSPVALGGNATINVSGPITPTTYTLNGVLFGNGSSAIGVTAQGAANTVLLGNGGVPTFGSVPNAALSNSSITLSNGANITVTGSPVSLGGTATIALSGATQHAVQIGSAAGALTSVPVGATNTVLLGSTGADPSFGAVPNAALSNSSVTLNNGNNITVTGGGPLSLGGTASFALTGTTNHAIQLGNASGSLTSASLLTNGQVLIGSTGNNPIANTLTAGTGITITNNAGTITISLTGSAMSTVPQLVFISSASASGGPVQFTSLSSTYSGFRFYFQSLTPSGIDTVIVQASSNNGVSYDTGNNYATGSTAKNGLIIAGTGTSINAQTGYCDILFTNQANDFLTCISYQVQSTTTPESSYYKIQAAINAVQFTVAGANNLASGTIYMFGIP